jgi:hypothetical protein
MAVKEKARKGRPSPLPGSLADLEVPAAPAKKPGLLDGVVKLFRTRMGAGSAFYAILAGAAVADGRVASEEDEEIVALSHRTKTLSKLDAAALTRIRTEIFARLSKPDRADLVGHAAKSLPAPMRLSAFGHACDIIFADRIVLKSEREFLTRLLADLSLGETEAADMLRMIRAKNAH